jgi:hypothetical protein
MSDLFSMVTSAFIMNHGTEEIIGVVTGIDTTGPRMRIKVALFDEMEDDDDDPEKEDVPEETIVEKIRAISGGKED